MEITVGLALIAGFVSFISPCVLPLVPAYIGYMGGRMGSTAAHQRPEASLQQRLSTFIHGLFFVFGFSLVFVTIGLLSTAFVQQVGGSNVRIITDLIGRLGGILIIFFGLHFMGVLRSLFSRLSEAALNQRVYPLLLGLVLSLLILWGFNGDAVFWNSYVWSAAPLLSIISLALVVGLWGWFILGNAFTQPGAFLLQLLNRLSLALYSDTRRTMDAPSSQRNYLDSVVMGVIFSAGWTPCIGPVYGAVLTMAANGGDVGQAGVLLATYSLGLGVPFLLTALLLDGVQAWLKRLQRHMGTIERVSGAFLVLIGVAVATGQLQRLSQQFAGDFAEFSIGVEAQVIELVTGVEITPIGADTGVFETVSELPPAEEIGLEVGRFAPDFQSVTAEGEPISLYDLRGSVVLLNFWATWCGPCRIEMPGLQRQYMTYGDQGFVVLAVNNAEPVDMVTAFRDQLRFTFPIVMDESGDIQRQFGIVNYPSTLLIDRDGRIAARHFGVVTPADVQRMLAEISFLS